jgi:hypothetical protein
LRTLPLGPLRAAALDLLLADAVAADEILLVELDGNLLQLLLRLLQCTNTK